LSRVRHVLVSTILALLALAAVEGILRLAGFRYEAAPMVLRFGYPDTREITDLFRPDSRLFWRLRPGSVFESGTAVRINEAGYRGPVAGDSGGPDLVRIAVLGDSVAFGAGTAWPEILQDRLEAALPGKDVEVLNFSVPGYSVEQGSRLFSDEVAGLRPRVVLVAYGWNDHWLARGGMPDHERRLPPAWRASLAVRLSRLRIVQAAHAIRNRLSSDEPSAEDVRRVPPSRYRDRVAYLVRESRTAGGFPVVLSLPSGLSEGEVPAYLVEMGFTADPERAILDHARYSGIARSVAIAERASHVDLDAAFRDDTGAPEPALFLRDRIHLSAEGHERAARLLEKPVLHAVSGGGNR
jgi:lysophospholipase L1-like esterase